MLTRTKPIAYTDQLPLIFRGGNAIPNIGISSVGKRGSATRESGGLVSWPVNSPFFQFVREILGYLRWIKNRQI